MISLFYITVSSIDSSPVSKVLFTVFDPRARLFVNLRSGDKEDGVIVPMDKYYPSQSCDNGCFETMNLTIVSQKKRHQLYSMFLCHILSFLIQQTWSHFLDCYGTMKKTNLKHLYIYHIILNGDTRNIVMVCIYNYGTVIQPDWATKTTVLHS